MSLKKTIVTGLLIAGMSIPAFASANKLTIHNDTDFKSTSKINGKCSTELLGAAGITDKRTKKDILDWQLRAVCRATPDNCRALVYLTPNCTGDVVTVVSFSLKEGITQVTPPKQGFSETHDAWYIKISQL